MSRQLYSKYGKLQFVEGNPKKYKPAETLKDHLNLGKKPANYSSPRSMSKWLFLPVMLIVGLQLSGCAQLGVNKAEVGAVTGAVLGGVAGSTFGGGVGKTVATIGGTIVGGAIGGAIGNYMDKVDKLEMNQALEKAKTDQTVNWSNPDNGAKFSVTPVKTYYQKQRPCRRYHMTAIIDGQARQVYGTACRDQNGQWVENG